MKWISSKQVRKLLGISKGTLEKWREEKVIPYFRVGGVIRYNLDKIQEFIANFEHEAARIKIN